jgi:lipid-A-disaccharide synthase-like uncharacterized protein
MAEGRRLDKESLAMIRYGVLAALVLLAALSGSQAAERVQGEFTSADGRTQVSLDLQQESTGQLKGKFSVEGRVYRMEGTPDLEPEHMDSMHRTLFVVMGLRISFWKLIGYIGTAIFAGRWFVQVHASRRARRPVMTRLFWLMSLSGSCMLLAYFIFGKNDSVGVLSNLFPSAVATYNLYLDIRFHRDNGGKGPTESADPAAA